RVRNPTWKKIKRMYEENKEKYKDRYVVEQVIRKDEERVRAIGKDKEPGNGKKSVRVKVIA
ncbi:MAG: hypothetical protein DRP27_04275, partial [Thermotogae bacterium]